MTVKTVPRPEEDATVPSQLTWQTQHTSPKPRPGAFSRATAKGASCRPAALLPHAEGLLRAAVPCERPRGAAGSQVDFQEPLEVAALPSLATRRNPVIRHTEAAALRAWEGERASVTAAACALPAVVSSSETLDRSVHAAR